DNRDAPAPGAAPKPKIPTRQIPSLIIFSPSLSARNPIIFPQTIREKSPAHGATSADRNAVSIAGCRDIVVARARSSSPRRKVGSPYRYAIRPGVTHHQNLLPIKSRGLRPPRKLLAYAHCERVGNGPTRQIARYLRKRVERQPRVNSAERPPSWARPAGENNGEILHHCSDRLVGNRQE